MTHKNIKKSRIFMLISTGCTLLRAEGFSCSLDVLYGGRGISKLQFLIKEIEIKFPAINFFPILGHQTPDPESGSAIRKNAGSALNQCRSETLLIDIVHVTSVVEPKIFLSALNPAPQSCKSGFSSGSVTAPGGNLISASAPQHCT
jgi:hypothetical protein